MSRLSFASKAMPSTTVYFGLDFPETTSAHYWVEVWEDGKEVPSVELYTGSPVGINGCFAINDMRCSRGEILDYLGWHGCPENYLHLIAMDLDPAS